MMENFNCQSLELKTAVETLGFATAKTQGISMLPFIVQGRDKVFIEKRNKRLKKHDIGVFVRSDGKFLMHRVKRVLESSYDFLGDNNFKKEKNISDELVIGVVNGYYKGEKFVDCNSFSYQFWSRIYCFPPIRICGVIVIRLTLKVRNFFKKMFKKN